ncbi:MULTISPECIES: hypothetical protein [unclassified Streptomyces]|uniref:hypothetical protein n=1 Tax=unclassified Streptomyces TaxID=2593676 RepID=UPI0035D861EB
MTSAAGTEEAAPVTRDELRARRREARHRQNRDQLLVQLRRILARYPYGVNLPLAHDLADWLGVKLEHVRAAMLDLETAGEIAFRGRRNRYRLRPDELHPMDRAFDKEIRDGINSGRFRPGTPLPTGLLSDRHHLSSDIVPRACRLLLADHLVVHRDGPAGPGYYVLPSPAGSALPSSSPLTEGPTGRG